MTGKVTLYAYDNDSQLKKAFNEVCKVEFKRDKSDASSRRNRTVTRSTVPLTNRAIACGLPAACAIQSTHTEDGF